MSKRGGSRGGVVKILLIIFGVLFLCMIIGAVYVGLHWKSWTAEVANVAVQGVLKESGLPSDQQESILVEVRQLGDDFKTGKITTEQISKVAKAISDSPLIPLAGVQVARHKYIEPSNMSETEKAEAVLSLQRFARGVFEKKISRDELNEAVKPVADVRGNGSWKIKDNPSRTEIDQFISNVKARADAAKIPDEPFDVNIADELKKAIHGG